ncbi:MAG: hypothetical protein FWG73_02345 [Planctomycetaceae bacterium]|nr:hypothetical protein [Planctomycetaceae bacterium]
MPDSSKNPLPQKEQNPPEQREKRKFVGVRFNCCNIYVRIYINKEGTGYEGRCPKCFRPVSFKVGSGGTDNRFFEAY